jgi:asparagine synthase (glutamine-hydrolysing)
VCGVAGAVGLIDSRIVDAVDAMHGAQRHRGPDGEGTWSSLQRADGVGVVLAHRRLAIIDISDAGHQPMVDLGLGNVVSFNGEIYNYREIRTELAQRGIHCTSQSDTEVLLRAYGAFGSECVKRFRGMFAFAIWDPTAGKLFLARDRLGIKPLYVYTLTHPNGQRTVLFASELRALLASNCVPRKLRSDPLAGYMWNGFVNGDQSIVAGIELLPAGHTAEISASEPSFRPRPFWELPRDGGSNQDPSALRETLAEAVRLRLVSDVPLGIFLSGGIDSSVVASMARQAGGAGLRTFTITFDEPEYDESRHARAVAQSLGTEHQEIRLGHQQFREQLDTALSSIDQPTFDAINTYFVSRAVREAGITVALAGTGGDELFGGYTSFSNLPRMRAGSAVAGRLPARLRAAAAALVTRLRFRSKAEVAPQTRWGKLRDILDARGDLLELYQIAYALYTRDFVSQLLRSGPLPPHFIGLCGEREHALRRRIADYPSLHAISTLELASFIEQRLLRDTDAASMAVSLEVRVPLLDHRFVEETAKMAPRRRFEPLGRKQLLREIGLSTLDPAIFERPKSGFVLPLDRWCREGLKTRVAEVLHDRTACERAGLAPDAVARLWRAFSSGAPGMYWSRVWTPFILVNWCEQHRVQV